LGRFLSIDPLAASTVTMSPYTGMNNNPVSMVDPFGLQGKDNLTTPKVYTVYSIIPPVQLSYATKNAPIGSLNATQVMGLVRGESMATVMGWTSSQGESKLQMQTGDGTEKVDNSIAVGSRGVADPIASSGEGTELFFSRSEPKENLVAPQVDKSGGLGFSGINENNLNQPNFNWEHLIGPGLIASGAEVIPKVWLKHLGIRSFVVPGATKATSAASVILRSIIPKSLPTLRFLPKAISLGGQLGRATPGLGWIITLADLQYIGVHKSIEYAPENLKDGIILGYSLGL
jgi:hypothetical protein